MKTDQYLAKHVHLLFECFKAYGKCFYIYHGKSYKASNQQEADKLLVGATQDVPHTEVLNEAQTVNAMKELGFDNESIALHVEDYICLLAKEDPQYLAHFLKTSQRWVGDVSIFELINVGKRVSIQYFNQLLEEGGKTLPTFMDAFLEELCSFASKHNSVFPLVKFFERHEKMLYSKSRSAIAMRDALSTYFSDLSPFAHLPEMDKFLNINTDHIFLKKNHQTTLYLQINFKEASRAFPVEDMDESDMIDNFLNFSRLLEKQQFHGMQRVHFVSNYSSKKRYEYSELYVTIDHDSLLDEQKIKQCLLSFFKGCQDFGITRANQIMDYDNRLNRILDKMNLSEKLSVNHAQTKRVKI